MPRLVRSTYTTADSLSLSLSLSASLTLTGPLRAKDMYVAVIMPNDGFFCLLLDDTGTYRFAAESAAEPLRANWVPGDFNLPNFHRFPSLTTLAPGNYTWVFMFTEPGADPADTDNWVYESRREITITTAPIVAEPEAPPPPVYSNITLGITTNNTHYRAGETLRLGTTINVTGPYTNKDVHVAVVWPDRTFHSLIIRNGLTAFGQANVPQAILSNWRPVSDSRPNLLSLPNMTGLVTGSFTWIIAITDGWRRCQESSKLALSRSKGY